MRQRLIISLLVVAVIAVIVSLPRTAPQTISALPREEVTQIIRAVRREMRHEVLPDVSLHSIGQLPSSLRRYFSEQIRSLYVEDDGTVSVMTGRKKNGVWYFHPNAFRLKRGPKGWVVTSRSSWISRSGAAPDNSLDPTADAVLFCARRESSIGRGDSSLRLSRLLSQL
jgi:hypothetical protein